MTTVAPRSMVAGRGRLTAEQLRDRSMTESDFQRAVVKLARDLGWGVTQSQAKAIAQEAAQYGVDPPPLDGLIYHPRYSLGSEAGWPDLFLARRRDRRLIFAELKAEKGVVSPRQREVLDLLREIAAGLDLVEVHVWRPSDLPHIAEVLR